MIRPSDPVIRITSRPAVAVEPEAALGEVIEVMAAEAIGAVVVAGSEKILGIISERDIVRAMGRSAGFDLVWAADVMTAEPIWAAPDDPIEDAAEMMVHAGVRHLPVVRGDQVIGVVSMRDALEVLTRTFSDTAG